MSVYGCIYEIVNKVNGKIYIGQTTMSLAKRWVCHKSCAKHRSAYSILHKAIRKYGPENFTIEIVTTASSKEELDRLEQTYIEGFGGIGPNGYNSMSGGVVSGKHSDSTRKKMSESHKGKPAWNKGVTGYSTSAKGKKLSPETIRKMSESLKGRKPWNKGKKLSDDHKASMSLAMIGKRISPSTEFKPGHVPPNIRPVIDSEGRIFESAYEAARLLGLQRAHISSCCCGKRKTTGGLSFQYYEPNQTEQDAS
jgi:group I intron endonuclease